MHPGVVMQVTWCLGFVFLFSAVNVVQAVT